MSQTRLSDFTFTFHVHTLEKDMATHCSVLAWESQGWGSLVGWCLWGHTGLDMTGVTYQQLSLQYYCYSTSDGLGQRANMNWSIWPMLSDTALQKMPEEAWVGTISPCLCPSASPSDECGFFSQEFPKSSREHHTSCFTFADTFLVWIYKLLFISNCINNSEVHLNIIRSIKTDVF